MTDERLLEQAASGDETAFAVIYERHRGLVFRFAYRLSQSREMADTEGRATAEGIIRMQFPDPEEKNSITCVLINPSTGKFIGYILAIERLPEPAKLKITIKPAEAGPDDAMDVAKVAKYLETIWPTKRGYGFPFPPSYPEPIVFNITDLFKFRLWAT